MTSIMGKLGHLNQINAFEFSQFLCLFGRASRPTLGWTELVRAD